MVSGPKMPGFGTGRGNWGAGSVEPVAGKIGSSRTSKYGEKDVLEKILREFPPPIWVVSGSKLPGFGNGRGNCEAGSVEPVAGKIVLPRTSK